MRDREIYSDACGNAGIATAEWRKPAGSRSIGVSLQPAIPRRVAPQQSPLPLHQSPTIVAQSQCGVRLRSSVALVVSAPNGCHLYFARRVTFLSCADIDSGGRKRRIYRLISRSRCLHNSRISNDGKELFPVSAVVTTWESRNNGSGKFHAVFLRLVRTVARPISTLFMTNLPLTFSVIFHANSTLRSPSIALVTTR